MLQARDIMTPEVITVSPQTKVLDLARLLAQHKINGAPVVDDQGRLQGIVVGAMPIFLALAMLAIDPGMVKVFFSSTIGMLVAGAVVVLEIFGALFIRKIVKIEV